MASPPLTSTYPGAMGDVGVEDVCMDRLPTLAKDCTEGDRSRPDILDERTDDGVAEERHEGEAWMCFACPKAAQALVSKATQIKTLIEAESSRLRPTQRPLDHGGLSDI